MLTEKDWDRIAAAAEAIGLHKDAARKWRERAQIPAERLPELSRRTKIPMKRLRPDLWSVGSAA